MLNRSDRFGLYRIDRNGQTVDTILLPKIEMKEASKWIPI